MKKKLFLLLLVLSIPVFSYSQINLVTAGVYGGVMLPMGDFADAFKVSPVVGVSGYYDVTPNIDIIADVAYNILTTKYATYTNTNFSYLESTAGVRYNFMPTKEKVFLEAEVGAYTYTAKYDYTLYGVPYSVSNSTTDFGFNIGAGALIPLAKNFSVMGRVKFHDILTSGSSTNYIGITAGFNYLFR
jgi:hypothetical protein